MISNSNFQKKRKNADIKIVVRLSKAKMREK